MVKWSTIVVTMMLATTMVYGQNTTELVVKGAKLFSRKNYPAAAEIYEQVYAVAPDDPEINFKLGLTYLELNKRTKSLPLLEKAHRLKPEIDEDIDYHLGFAYLGNHQFEKATGHFEEFGRKNKKV